MAIFRSPFHLKNNFYSVFKNRCISKVHSSKAMSINVFDVQHFEEILKEHYEKGRNPKIDYIAKMSACKPGVNYVSRVSRIHVNGIIPADYSKYFIVKELPTEKQSDLYRSKIAMENEVFAYKILVPVLTKYFSQPSPFLKCVYADPENGIVLPDFADCTDPENKFEVVGLENFGLNIEQCEIVLKGLAKLHAASLVMKERNPKKFQSMTNEVKDLFFHEGDSELLELLDERIEDVERILRRESVYFVEGHARPLMVDVMKNSRSKIKDVLLNPGAYSVFCHGDCWAPNIAFNKKKELKLIDLQQMRYNSVATDIDYLLFTNLHPNVHFTNRERLLEVYLTCLRENVKKHGVDMDNILVKEWLEEEIRRCIFYGFIMGLWIMPAFYNTVDDEGVVKMLEHNRIAYNERIESYVYRFVGYYHSFM